MALAGSKVAPYIRTDTTSPTGADEPSGIKKFSLGLKVDEADISDFKNNAGAHAVMALLNDASPTLSGDYIGSDTVQQLIRANGPGGATPGTTLYLTTYLDPNGTAGNKGYRLPVICTGIEPDGEVNGVVQVTYSFKLNGAPVAV